MEITAKELSQKRKYIIRKLTGHESSLFDDIKGLRLAKTDEEKKGWENINVKKQLFA